MDAIGELELAPVRSPANAQAKVDADRRFLAQRCRKLMSEARTAKRRGRGGLASDRGSAEGPRVSERPRRRYVETDGASPPKYAAHRVPGRSNITSARTGTGTG
jgi:hypothetical protein